MTDEKLEDGEGLQRSKAHLQPDTIASRVVPLDVSLPFAAKMDSAVFL